jgi:CubicO group peptidase (beta-lactamase class C family)
LRHEGGFDRDLVPSPRWSGGFAPPPALADTSYGASSGDPNFKPVLMMHDLEVATGLDFTGPLRPKELVQYMAGFCLAFAPGTRMAYSNFGYTLLGRVLEGIHGREWEPGNGTNRRIGWGPYIDIIEEFLAEYGITSGIRAGGTGSYSSENLDWVGSDEPYYRHLRDDGSEYPYLNVGDAFGVSPSGDMYFGPPAGVPGPYGAFSMQTMEAHGGLVATAPALIKFMRHFRLRNVNDYGTIGTPRADPSVGNTAHWGLLPGTYSLAWEMGSGDQTFMVPFLLGAWDQTSASSLVISTQTNCTLPTGIDVVALFNQSTDPKDPADSEYSRLSHFLGRAACQVTTWPNPLSPTSGKVAQ